MQVGAVAGTGGFAINKVRAESGACVRLVPLEPEEASLLPTAHASALTPAASRQQLTACMMMVVYPMA